MVRFSCFDARLHFRKHKKVIRLSSEAKLKILADSSPKKALRNSSYLTIRQSGELLQKTLEDSSSKKALKNSSYLTTENKSCLNEEGHIHCNIADNVTENSSTEHDCRSEEMDGKSNTDCDIIVHKNAQMRKSQTFGGRLNWEEKTSGADGSEEETEGSVSYGGSAHHSRTVVLDRVNDNGFRRIDQVQEPLPSDSLQDDSDSANNMPIFSIGEPEQTEKEGADKEDIDASGQGDSSDFTPHTHTIIKSSSLPSLGALFRCSASFLPHSRSAEDMRTLDSRKKDTMHEVGRGMQYQERVNSMPNNDKNTDENPAEETYENYKYVGSVKDWIMPLSHEENKEKGIKGETSFHHLIEVPANDFRLRRTKEWIINLQNCSPSAESDKPSPCYDQEIPEGSALVEEPSISKLEVNVNSGMEAEKRYISSLNPSATEAQLTNLGLTVIPFVSTFFSLKVLNLSGNAIVRIASGALPRGLHILNLSKNNISTIEGLRDLTRLRVLDLSYNRILRIGHGLASCSSIKELYLAGNKISEAEGLHRLLKLNVLDLGFNRISTTKCLGQLAANYNCLQAIILEGNPAQKNVGNEQLKKCVLSLLPRLTFYNMQLVKAGTMKDGLGIGGYQAEAKTIRRLASHGSAALKTASSFNHDRKSLGIAPPRKSRSKHGRSSTSGMKTAQGHQFTDFNSKLVGLRNDNSFSRSQSTGNLGSL